VNENLVVWTTDWHVVSFDGEPAGTGTPTSPTKAQQVVAYLNSLEPAGCIDTGDNKDHYGADTGDEQDNYVTYVGNELAWLPVNPGVNALYPTLPGNHDEVYDYTAVGVGNNHFPLFDARFWGAPYHWTADWEAPRIRFIAFHAYIHHTGSTSGVGVHTDQPGFFHVDSNEVTWLQNELSSLPPRWQAIVCCHPPMIAEYGNNLRYLDDVFDFAADNVVVTTLASYGPRVAAALSGHRHNNWGVIYRGTLPYIVSGGVSYGLGNGYGVLTLIRYDPNARSLTFDVRYARPASGFPAFTAPFTIQLQPHRLYIARS
jgi:hypothetical protein